MQEDKIAFKRKLRESQLKAARRLQLQRGFGLLAVAASLAILYLQYLR